MKGPAPIDGDNLNTELRASQAERAMLENLQESRKPGPKYKTLTIPEIEERLESIVRARGKRG